MSASLRLRQRGRTMDATKNIAFNQYRKLDPSLGFLDSYSNTMTKVKTVPFAMKRLLFVKNGGAIERTKAEVDLSALIAEYGITISTWMATAVKFARQGELKIPATADNGYAKGVFKIAANPETGDVSAEFHRSGLVHKLASRFNLLKFYRKPEAAVEQTAEAAAQTR